MQWTFSDQFNPPPFNQKSVLQEFDIDPEADGDQVDELLAMCVRQAVQS